MIPISEYFRILVVGETYKPIADLIESKLGFRTTLCKSQKSNAIVVGGSDVGTAVEARAARGFAMPIFLLSKREEENFEESYLQELGGVFIADLEACDFYRKRLLASAEKYVTSLMTPFFGALMRYAAEPASTPMS